jgi:hypothetical protein
MQCGIRFYKFNSFEWHVSFLLEVPGKKMGEVLQWKGTEISKVDLRGQICKSTRKIPFSQLFLNLKHHSIADSIKR